MFRSTLFYQFFAITFAASMIWWVLLLHGLDDVPWGGVFIFSVGCAFAISFLAWQSESRKG